MSGAVDLIVAGAPLLGFSLPTENMVQSLVTTPGAPSPADVSHPSMRSWLESLPQGQGAAATFETRIWWSPGSAAKAILQQLTALGYAALDKPQRFVVEGKFGPLRDGEIERAEAWGAALAAKFAQANPAVLKVETAP